MDCRDSALFTGVDEVSCENMLRCFSAYEQRFSAGQTILTCGEQQDMIGVLLSGSAALLRLHADGNRTGSHQNHFLSLILQIRQFPSQPINPKIVALSIRIGDGAAADFNDNAFCFL